MVHMYTIKVLSNYREDNPILLAQGRGPLLVGRGSATRTRVIPPDRFKGDDSSCCAPLPLEYINRNRLCAFVVCSCTSRVLVEALDRERLASGSDLVPRATNGRVG